MRYMRNTLAALLLLAISVIPMHASADVNAFTIDNFHADETLTRADKQGELHVVEHIYVTFTDNNHGIVRAIPAKYKGQNLRFQLRAVSSDTRAPNLVTRQDSNGNVVLRIGSPNVTVTGPQEYTIDYTLQNVISFYPDHDELYWDVNGDQWQQPFTKVSVSLHTPADAAGFRAPQCFVGGYGSTGTGCTTSTEQNTVTATASNLSPGQTMTYVVGFQPGYFTPMTFWQRLSDLKVVLVELVLPPLLAFALGFSWWLKSGRDAKGRGTIIPEYSPPEGLSLLEAGTIADFKVDNRDITATYIDLARRGYITIHEVRQDRLLMKDKVSYQLELKIDDYSALKDDERKLMSAMFSVSKPGALISLDDMQTKLSSTARDLRKSVDKHLLSAGYFRNDPNNYAIKGTLFAVVVLALQLFAGLLGNPHTWAIVPGLIAGIVILFVFIGILPARTAQGVAAREQLLGLKLYMETAEKDRLEKLEGPEAAYAPNVGAPERTVELFEKLLPYAIVLGVENQWATKFNDIYTSPPDWYAGNWTTFNAGYLAGSLNTGFAPAINTSFAAPSSSGSSGFGGGGFSGGGGGGGGGGGW